MEHRPTDLLGIEKVTLGYILFTTILIGIFWTGMNSPLTMLGIRGCVILLIAAIYGIYQFRPTKTTYFIRQVALLFLLPYWYPETYEFCRQFPNLDHIFAGIDLELFGCQPSMVFSEVLPGKIWSELFNAGYFAYFPMIIICVLLTLFGKRKYLGQTVSVILICFFFYYTIYIFLPVAGPYYYFPTIGHEAMVSGQYPELHDYFRTHIQLPPSASDTGGFFRSLVTLTQESGERPTAAFPSSHVGMSTIVMLLTYRLRKSAFWIFLPLYILLCGATVYISAHYLIDSICGLISAPIFLAIAFKIYRRIDDGDARAEHLVGW